MNLLSPLRGVGSSHLLTQQPNKECVFGLFGQPKLGGWVLQLVCSTAAQNSKRVALSLHNTLELLAYFSFHDCMSMYLNQCSEHASLCCNAYFCKLVLPQAVFSCGDLSCKLTEDSFLHQAKSPLIFELLVSYVWIETEV